ncbi:MAG TPA: hypothetical protein VFE45_06760 [Coriobacteriia bacterium]|nr:hypothetical protein [Coriobacteriia bacterium]
MANSLRRESGTIPVTKSNDTEQEAEHTHHAMHRDADDACAPKSPGSFRTAAGRGVDQDGFFDAGELVEQFAY